MNFRIYIGITLTALILLWGGMCFASEKPSLDGTQVAQFSDMKGAGAAADSEDDAADLDDFDDDFDEYDTSKPIVSDPFYGFNLVMFHINDGLYHGVFKPVATGYNWLVPAKPRQWVRNFFTNMLFPVRFVNDVFQGKFDAAYMEFSKFLANTSWGLLGFVDVTSDMKRNWEPARPTADGTGQTLGKAGFGHGFYIVWPIIGPSSLRETAGWVGDMYLDPLTYTDLTFIEFAAVRTFKNLNNLSLQLKGNEYEAITNGAIDKYAAVRDAYIRFRAKKVEE